MKAFGAFLLCFFVTLFLFFSGCAKTENEIFVVGGKVIAYGEGLEGVEISVNGTDWNCATDTDGNFELIGVNYGDLISFSKNGYSISNYEVTGSVSNLIIVAYLLNSVELVYDSGRGSVLGKGDYIKNSTVTLTASPSYGFAFNGYYVDGALACSDAEYSFIITEDIEVEARFDEILITVTVESDYLSLITGAGEYRLGTSATLTASETEAAAFAGWYIGGNLVGTSSVYVFTAAEAVTLEARFYAVLNAPALSIDDYTVYWQPVENAANYAVSVNGQAPSVQNDTEFDFSAYLTVSGEYGISVKALSGSENILDSPASTITYIYYAKISAPYNVGVTFNEKIILNFTAVNAAVDYEVNVGGATYLLSDYPDKTEYLLNSVHFDITDLLETPGEYTASVTAIAENSLKNSLPSAPAVFTYSGELEIPSLEYQNGSVTWSSVPNCELYSLAVNGVTVYSTSDNNNYSTQELEEGTYQITVTATATGYAPSEHTITINITK